MSDLTHAWDRQPDEPSNWYDRFDRYFRAQGPERTMNQAYRAWYADKHGYALPSGRQCSTDWSVKAKEWGWRDRADAWDEYMWAAQRDREEDDLREMRSRHIKDARANQEKAMDALAGLDINDAANAFRIWKQAVGVERVARGVSEGMTDFEDMTSEEILDAYQREIEQAGQRANETSVAATSGTEDEGTADTSVEVRDDAGHNEVSD